MQKISAIIFSLSLSFGAHAALADDNYVRDGRNESRMDHRQIDIDKDGIEKYEHQMREDRRELVDAEKAHDKDRVMMLREKIRNDEIELKNMRKNLRHDQNKW